MQSRIQGISVTFQKKIEEEKLKTIKRLLTLTELGRQRVICVKEDTHGLISSLKILYFCNLKRKVFFGGAFFTYVFCSISCVRQIFGSFHVLHNPLPHYTLCSYIPGSFPSPPTLLLVKPTVSRKWSRWITSHHLSKCSKLWTCI